MGAKRIARTRGHVGGQGGITLAHGLGWSPVGADPFAHHLGIAPPREFFGQRNRRRVERISLAIGAPVMQRTAVDIGQNGAFAQSIEVIAPISGDKGGRVATVRHFAQGGSAQDAGSCKCCKASGNRVAAGKSTGGHWARSSLL